MKDKKGFVSLEVVLFSSAIIILLVIIIGMFSFIYPTFTIQRNVDVLARQAQRNGGLTSYDISNFEKNMDNYPFVKNSNLKVEITAKTNPGNYSAMGVTSGSYITRESGEIMNIQIKVPSDNRTIKRFNSKISDYYIFETSVVSEKNEAR